MNEVERESLTRRRVSGHSLAGEVNRWNRRWGAGLPLAEKLCSCEQIQTESHVIEHCPRISALRQQFQLTTKEKLMQASATCQLITLHLTSFCHCLMMLFYGL